jgi:hypothetical protein
VSPFLSTDKIVEGLDGAEYVTAAVEVDGDEVGKLAARSGALGR